ncbi:MAG TPA: GAF domain-containing protein [Accumulibacter sp.]|nr:GAF domain-containing protein [Accumulibacter sp.]HMW16701.1 GAF domain-containing protein [Accumulibacter sp.]HMX21491.1 GAF domain-containing protein [Accumulibacter sp.]HMY05656.1 GAF domain-containing protein [Accumulibacter sp.]HNC18099.1 GAF domain-containing protein [Accumulibacter sp.]
MFPRFPLYSSALDLQGAFAQLSKRGFAAINLDETLRQLTASTGRMLNVERVSLWGLTQHRSALECIDLYELSSGRHSHGLIFAADRFPEYFKAFFAGEPLVVDDSLKHPATQELVDDYLLVNGISAVVHSPIHVNGELQGTLWIEQVGGHSAWTSVQRLFAHAVASLVGLALLQHQLTVVEDELRDAKSLQRALFTGAHEAIVLSDAVTGDILDANPQAEKLFGLDLQQLLGAMKSSLYAPDDGAGVPRLIRRLIESGSTQLHSQVRAPDGTVIPVEITRQIVELETGKTIVQDFFRPLNADSQG